MAKASRHSGCIPLINVRSRPLKPFDNKVARSQNIAFILQYMPMSVAICDHLQLLGTTCSHSVAVIFGLTSDIFFIIYPFSRRLFKAITELVYEKENLFVKKTTVNKYSGILSVERSRKGRE